MVILLQKWNSQQVLQEKRRGFWIIYNENLAPNKSECIDVLGQVLQWTMYKIFSQKYEDFSKRYQKYKLEITRNMNTKHK
jgi:hypothetical protein